MGESSDHIQVPIAELYTIASHLETVKQAVEHTEPFAQGLEGGDKFHGARIQGAVEHFFAEWKQSRTTLLENVGVLGEVSSSIADQTAQFDGQMASDIGNLGEQIRTGGEG